jgi:hypothetical protein
MQNRVLRRIFGPKRDEVTGGCKILHNEELHSLCSSLDIIMVMKSRRMRWAGHVVRKGQMRNAYIFFCCKVLKGRGPDIDGKIILKSIVGK